MFFVANKLASQAIRIYINAVDGGNLIVTLPRLSSSAPSSSSSSSRNHTSRRKVAYSGPSPESLKITLSIELDCIKKLPTDNRELMWVFRRHGYNERENPDHLVTVLSSMDNRGRFLLFFLVNASMHPLTHPSITHNTTISMIGAIVEIYRFKALDPTIEEVPHTSSPSPPSLIL